MSRIVIYVLFIHPWVLNHNQTQILFLKMSHVAEKSPSVVEYDSDSSTEWSGALYGVRRYLGMIG